LEFLGVPQGRYRLETSSDLRLWQTLESGPATVRPGEFKVQVNATKDARCFFRVSEY
jgi:hypothetical protein